MSFSILADQQVKKDNINYKKEYLTKMRESRRLVRVSTLETAQHIHRNMYRSTRAEAENHTEVAPPRSLVTAGGKSTSTQRTLRAGSLVDGDGRGAGEVKHECVLRDGAVAKHLREVLLRHEHQQHGRLAVGGARGGLLLRRELVRRETAVAVGAAHQHQIVVAAVVRRA